MLYKVASVCKFMCKIAVVCVSSCPVLGTVLQVKTLMAFL